MTEPILDITWDDAKANINLGKHGVTFAQAATVMLDPLALTVFDDEHSEYEDRWFTIGLTSEGRLLAVSHTHEAISEQQIQIRLISARDATPREKHDYETI